MSKILRTIGKIIKIIKINSDPYLDLKYKDFLFRNSVITRFNTASLLDSIKKVWNYHINILKNILVRVFCAEKNTL